MANERYIEDNAKRCPRCGVAIQKTGKIVNIHCFIVQILCSDVYSIYSSNHSL